MSQVIPFRPVVQPAQAPDIATLSARLIQVESAETADEDLLDLLLEAEGRTLAELAGARAGTVAEVALKLAAVVRRAGDERDGPLSSDELDLLRSSLRDLQRLSSAAPAAARA